MSFWRLGTGSHLAYVRIPGVAPRRPTPVVVLHGGPGVPDNPSDASGDRATAGLATGRRLRSYAAALEPRALLGYLLLQVDPAAAHAYLPDAEADARNDTILTTAEPALHCTPAQAHGRVWGSGFYRLQYPQSATASARPTLAQR